MKTISVPLIVLYAVLEGVFLGAFSQVTGASASARHRQDRGHRHAVRLRGDVRRLPSGFVKVTSAAAGSS